MAKIFKDNFQSLDFLILFCATCILQNDYSFNKDNLSNFIYECKCKNEFQRLLGNTEPNIDISLAILETLNILKINGSEIVINENVPIIEMIRTRLSYVGDMTGFTVKFKKIEIKTICDSKVLYENSLSLNKVLTKKAI